VAVEVRPAPAVWVAAVRHPYPSSPTEQGLRVEMGDLDAREPKRLLLELLVEAVPGSGDAEVATVSLAADVLEIGDGIVYRELDLPVTLDVDGGPRVDPEVRREALRLDAARARSLEEERKGERGAAAGELQEAGRKLREGGIGVDRADMRHRAYDRTRGREAARRRLSRGKHR
jgi:hypothetical protein